MIQYILKGGVFLQAYLSKKMQKLNRTPFSVEEVL